MIFDVKDNQLKIGDRVYVADGGEFRKATITHMDTVPHRRWRVWWMRDDGREDMAWNHVDGKYNNLMKL